MAGLLVLAHENMCQISSRGPVFRPQVKGLQRCFFISYFSSSSLSFLPVNRGTILATNYSCCRFNLAGERTNVTIMPCNTGQTYSKTTVTLGRTFFFGPLLNVCKVANSTLEFHVFIAKPKCVQKQVHPLKSNSKPQRPD